MNFGCVDGLVEYFVEVRLYVDPFFESVGGQCQEFLQGGWFLLFEGRGSGFLSWEETEELVPFSLDRMGLRSNTLSEDVDSVDDGWIGGHESMHHQEVLPSPRRGEGETLTLRFPLGEPNGELNLDPGRVTRDVASQ